MKTNLKKFFVLAIIAISFNLNLYAGEEDITIVLFTAEQKIEAYVPEESIIESIQIFQLYNPGQYCETLYASSCEEDLNFCIYYFSKENLIEGQVYRIHLYVSTQNTPVVYTFVA